MTESPLQILGLTPGTSSLKEAKSSFKSLSLKYHPDKNKDPSASKKFISIKNAYEFLEKNPHLLHEERSSIRGESLSIEVPILPEELYFTTKKIVKIKKRVSCRSCNGTGSEDKVLHTCVVCFGTGVLQNKVTVILDQESQCNTCRGKGVCPKEKCSVCHGYTLVDQDCTESIPITSETLQSRRVILKGKGNAGICQGPYGDLYIQFKAILGKSLIINNQLVMDLYVSPVQYLIGDDVTFDLLGKKISVKLPPKSNGHFLTYMGKKISLQIKIKAGAVTEKTLPLYKEILRIEKQNL